MYQYALYSRLRKEGKTAKLDINWFEAEKANRCYELTKAFTTLDIGPEDYSTKTERIPFLWARRFAHYRRLFGLGSGQSRFYLQDRGKATVSPNICRIKGPCYYDGYWGNEAIFLPIAQELCQEFRFNADDLSEENRHIRNLIQTTPSVSIHVRRGDFLSSPAHELCEHGYYTRAIAQIRSQVPDAQFFVFSEDIPWCQEVIGRELKGQGPHYIDWNRGDRSYIDMYLMSLCQHNIIANSAFSWWSAWLGGFHSPAGARRLVIAPKDWLRGGDCLGGPLPANWQTMANLGEV